jgi:hypothetical protein
MNRMKLAFEHDGTATGIAMRATERGREASLIAMVYGDRRDAFLMLDREEHKKRARTSVRILSIDAWRDGDGWQWNNWFRVGSITLAELVLLDTPRKQIGYMRRMGYLSAKSAGRVRVDDDGSLNLTFLDRGTEEPLFAIEYGAHD